MFSHQDRVHNGTDYGSIWNFRATLQERYEYMAVNYSEDMAQRDLSVAPFRYAISKPYWDPATETWLILSTGNHPCVSVASCGPQWVR